MISNEQLNAYLQLLSNGRSPEEIKKDMLRLGVNEKEASETLHALDSVFLQRKTEHESTVKGNRYKIAGWLILSISIILTFSTLIYATLKGGIIIFLGGGITAGLGMIIHGNRLKKPMLFLRQQVTRQKFRRKY